MSKKYETCLNFSFSERIPYWIYIKYKNVIVYNRLYNIVKEWYSSFQWGCMRYEAVCHRSECYIYK